jgi:multidrug efflux system outer membrane protein
MMRAATGVILALCVTGCMVGPDYHRPATPTPQTYLYEPKETVQPTDADWWKGLGDPVLDQLIVEALTNNKDLMIATANVQSAAAVLTQTRSPLFPQVGYGATAGRYQFSSSQTVELPANITNPTNYYSVLAGASWEIDLWGRIRRLSQAAQATLFATEDTRRGVILTLITQLTTSYIQLRALDDELVIAQRTLDTYGASLKLTKDKFEFGQVSQMNVAQVESQYETVAARIPQLRNQIVLTEMSIGLLLGRNPGSIPRGKSIHDLKLMTVPAGVPSELLERRPDILQAEQQLVAATAQIGAAKAQYFPSISLTGQWGSGSTQLHDLFNSTDKVWHYVGGLSGPIFAGGSITAQVKQARAQQQAALANYQRVIQNAFADVDESLSTREQLIAQVAAQELLVKALQDYSELAELQYNGGYAPYSTVLQAEQQLFPQELNLAEARGELLASLVTIYRSMGGAWVAGDAHAH